MATFWERASHLVNHNYVPFVLCLFVILVDSHFNIDGETSVPISQFLIIAYLLRFVLVAYLGFQGLTSKFYENKLAIPIVPPSLLSGGFGQSYIDIASISNLVPSVCVLPSARTPSTTSINVSNIQGSKSLSRG